jgi:hypothetical protein
MYQADDGALWKVLRRSYFMSYEGLMKLVKACLLQSRYREAAGYIGNAFCRRDFNVWKFERYAYRLAPIMETKLHLCACLAFTALGKIGDGIKRL